MLHDCGDESSFLACNRALAQTNKTLVGVYLAKSPVRSTYVDNESLQARDLKFERLRRRRSLNRKRGHGLQGDGNERSSGHAKEYINNTSPANTFRENAPR